MKALSKSDLLQPLSLKTVKHALPEWGEGAYVNIKALSSADLVEMQKSFGANVDATHSFEFALMLLSFCLVDEEGQRLFADEKEVKGLLCHSPKLIEQLGKVAVEVSGIGAEKKRD